ncbi:NAD(P)H-dependent glycerol-3-phosphate dehydrogenase [Geosporobacter ferrireducens]|uniref:Glycerol-3-phosphate dehydrogenase n=1 Tax=Geosporobacter ferrireducens TaxID=1424294 RepID=A0A1D8GNW7_9FIRM|nr:2-dehydropantoate 2-reductase N-terminal domain-containing protein [Geosporobacter ferrireducens]AOT72630.1 glycerol-3-phosphate dehydrogenase [Geosporobacter ferrireducens]MTI55032.1 glycerol-3-phosphate dehydrogenase [Geosporobacter ferrireducens]
MAKVTIIGAGAMGSALTVPLTENGHQVRLWGTELDSGIIEKLRKGLPHPKHKHHLPPQIETYQADELSEATKDAELVIMAITSDALGIIFERVVPYLKKGMIVGSVSKGFDYSKNGQIVILPEILEALLPKTLCPDISLIVVGGPCKAVEVVWRSPTAVTYSSKNIEAAKFMQSLLMTEVYRVEVTTDVIGTEVCAAMKNAYSVGLGLAEGFKTKQGFLHNNTKAALFAFATAEMGILTKAMGGSLESVIGLPGIGDLEVTGEAGRNRMLGEVIGGGLPASKAIEKMKQEGITVEGYPAIKFGYYLAKQLEQDQKLSIDQMPLLEGLYNILYNNAPAYQTVMRLLQNCTGYYK